ncbi:MAG: adenylate kinase [Bacteroidia bacterium]
MLNIVLFGPPGAGKGTQSQKLVDKYHLVHLSTGDLLRSEINHGTSLGMQAKAIMDRGELVSDDIVIRMIESKLDANPNAKGFIFDGFPRTTAQAEALDELLKSKNNAITMMLALEVDNAELTRRLLSRGEETGRPDDRNEEVIKNRINEYNTKTAPLKQYYSHKGKFHSVYGIGDVDQIFELLCATIENKTREKNHVHNDGTVTVADISFDDEPKHSKKQEEPEVEMEIVEIVETPEAVTVKSTLVTAVPRNESKTVVAKKKAAPAKAAAKKAVKKAAAKKAAPAKVAKKKSAPKKLASTPLSKLKVTKKVAPKKAVKKTAKKSAPKKKAIKKIVKKAAPKKLAKKAGKKLPIKKVLKKSAKKVMKKSAPKKTASARSTSLTARPISKRKTVRKTAPKKDNKKTVKKSMPKKVASNSLSKRKAGKKTAVKKAAKKKKR